MALGSKNSQKVQLRRIGAVLVCLALLYFAAGGSFLHRHQTGHDTVCHVCQSLHASALAPSVSGIASAPEVSAWLDSQSDSDPVQSEFPSLHSGRAPPSA